MTKIPSSEIVSWLKTNHREVMAITMTEYHLAARNQQVNYANLQFVVQKRLGNLLQRRFPEANYDSLSSGALVASKIALDCLMQDMGLTGGTPDAYSKNGQN